MSAQNRKDWTRIALRVAVLLLVLDALAYVGVERPLAAMVTGEQEQFAAQRLAWQRERANLAAIEKRDEALPVQARKVNAFLSRHIPRRREGFSRAALLVQRLAQQSGVKLAGISYSLEKGKKGEPLEHLSIAVNTEGSFGGLLGFAHSLETASDFIVVRSFKFQTAEAGALALRVNADLYLMP